MILKKVTTHGNAKYVRSDPCSTFEDRDPIRVTYFLFGIPVFRCTYIRHYEGMIPYEVAVKEWSKLAKEKTSTQSLDK